MCGIAGFFGRRTVEPHRIAAMLAELGRRGPDAQHVVGWNGNWARTDDSPVSALLHARLSIIDPRPEADQPMANDTGDVWICYNGEVYGWERERDALVAQGVRFHTRCDTEFILRGYEAWGFEKLIARLRGMFALVILDLRSKVVWAARDRMGLKPLVYSHAGDGFAFGSTVRSILPWLSDARRELSPAAIDAYLAHRYVPAPRTVFHDVSRLENGHWLRFDLDTGRLKKHCYWRPEPHAADWRATLDEAIRLRTVADRPVGLFLSGGIDSSLLACRLGDLGYRQITSFTAAFPGSAMDESEDAARIANRLGLPNRRIEIPDTIAADFARIVADLDEPFADPSCFPTWYLSRATSREVKVVLGGDGGDELFAGYKRIAKHLRTRWRTNLRLPLPIVPAADSRNPAKLLTELALGWTEAYSLRFSGFTPNQRRFLQPDFRPEQPTYWRLPATPAPRGRDRLLEVDLANYLPEYILRKADLCTMAHGLELRAPLLDHRLVEALTALPPDKRFTQPPKRLLEPLLAPLAELDPFRRKKRGFNPPLTNWLTRDLAERFDGLGDRLAAVTGGQLAARAVEEVASRYRNGSAHLAEQVLQLLILDEALGQLRRLTETP